MGPVALNLLVTKGDLQNHKQIPVSILLHGNNSSKSRDLETKLLITPLLPKNGKGNQLDFKLELETEEKEEANWLKTSRKLMSLWSTPLLFPYDIQCQLRLAFLTTEALRILFVSFYRAQLDRNIHLVASKGKFGFEIDHRDKKGLKGLKNAEKEIALKLKMKMNKYLFGIKNKNIDFEKTV